MEVMTSPVRNMPSSTQLQNYPEDAKGFGYQPEWGLYTSSFVFRGDFTNDLKLLQDNYGYKPLQVTQQFDNQVTDRDLGTIISSVAFRSSDGTVHTHAFVADADIATANVNGATSSSTAVTLDGNVGTVAVGDIVTGTGITGATSGVVRVATVTSQTNIALDTAVSLSDDTVLTFDGSNILFVGALDASKSVAAGDIFRINAGNLSIELK